MYVTDKIRELIREKGLTQNQFNEAVHISKNTLRNWEKAGAVPPSAWNTLVMIAQFFAVPIEVLTGETDDRFIHAKAVDDFLEYLENNGFVFEENEDETVTIGIDGKYLRYTRKDFMALCEQFYSQSGPELAMKSWAREMFPTREDLKRIFVTQPASMQHELPVYGDVSAGIGCNAEQHIIGWEVAGDEYDEDEYFYLLVEGDSMSPEIKNGDYVLVHSQDVIESGQIAVVVVDGEGLVKKIEMGEDYITLISINPYYPPRVFKEYDMNRVHIIGRVCEAKRKY